MSARPKILLLDDEQDLLELYKEILSQLPSQPEVHLANSGARAIALLESEPFNLLISDLRMPKMDGLQVLSIVRRKFPDLRVVVMTSVADEQYRSRAYAMGVDLFWEKPNTPEEIKMFQDCIASLAGRDTQSGFRGVQSKSLMDIIQIECLSQNSSVLKIVNGSREGKVWVLNGEIIDAITGDASSHAAFKQIFSWKGGSFEILPAEPDRKRTITENYQGLLLDTMQAIDEAKGAETAAQSDEQQGPAVSVIASLARTEGVEFVLQLSNDGKKNESWGVEHAEPLAEWIHETWKGFHQLGERLRIGEITHLHGIGLQRHAAISGQAERQLCVGFKRTLTAMEVRETMKKIKEKWVS
jgi:CheY-like chemotaxis protein